MHENSSTHFTTTYFHCAEFWKLLHFCNSHKIINLKHWLFYTVFETDWDWLIYMQNLHLHKYTLVLRIWGRWDFERSVSCSPRLHLFDQKYSKNIHILKYYYNFKSPFSIWIHFKMKCISVIQSWIFSIISPVFNITWSFRYYYNILSVYYYYNILICCSRNISDYYQCYKIKLNKLK